MHFVQNVQTRAAVSNFHATPLNVQVLRHDIGEKKKVGTISEAYPHLIINQFSSKLGQRVGNILKFLFPAPKVSSCALLALAPPHHAT